MMSSMMMDRCGGEYAHEIAESLRFQEEIQSLMRLEPPGPESGSSFTALLGLPPNQAMELLHHEPPGQPPPAATVGNTNVREAVIVPSYGVDIPFGCSPTFPSNAALVERAARYSVFASPAEDSPVSSTVPSNSGGNNISHYSGSYRVKSEPADSDSNNGASSFAIDKPPQPSTPATGGQQRSGKRKEPEKSKAKSGGGGRGKKSKGGDFCEDDGAKGSTGGEKLPYVHVRARRGQATDSHSLAERARREKINARMKLLQELVPGCSKISGTALVLDEIINHVQSLQRQVEFLSMRLAAVNPGVDFSGIDNFLAAENARLTGGNEVGAVGLEAPLWGEVPIDGIRRHHHQRQIWQPDQVSPQQSPSMWEREDNNRRDHHHHYSHEFIAPGHSMLCYETATPVPLHANQLKTEI